ncbi:ribonuclease HII [Halarcobacter mediterraneus]|uniref:Ribonuclease HII n=1 Tax=Halarcobacter mediterraneus TaxID=2023153 RepID=A0A4V1M0Z6_9BACT|nr:phosphatidylglycerol lysyltransferase domain-containing protein [Halarcobacter mediterraneus]RXK11604.1 ribonuclease HII [Halarcobacter mediterraneus]
MSTLTIGTYKLKHFDLNAKELMDKYLKLISVDLSDYTFAGNYIWLSTATGFYTIVNDTFCLFILNSGELTMLLPPLGKKNNTYKAILECFEIMNKHNSNKNYSKIEYVHENILEGFVDYLEEGTLIYEMLKDFIIEKKLVDYIYKVDDLISLKGDSYKSKRNEINKFKKIYPEFSLEILNKTKHGNDVLNLFNKWVKDRTTYMPKEEVEIFLDGIYFERFAIKRLINDYENLDIIGLVIYIDGEIKGFTVGEKINENTASVIIEKTDFEVLGCAQFIFREFTKILKDKYNIEYINVGDDMGFENLKKVKMSYRPNKLIPKYTIYQK